MWRTCWPFPPALRGLYPRPPLCSSPAQEPRLEGACLAEDSGLPCPQRWTHTHFFPSLPGPFPITIPVTFPFQITLHNPLHVPVSLVPLPLSLHHSYSFLVSQNIASRISSMSHHHLLLPQTTSADEIQPSESINKHCSLCLLPLSPPENQLKYVDLHQTFTDCTPEIQSRNSLSLSLSFQSHFVPCCSTASTRHRSRHIAATPP